MADVQPDIDALLRQARQGDSDALLAVLQHFHDEIRIIAQAHLRFPARRLVDSDDLVQTVHQALVAGLGNGHYEVPNRQALLKLVKVIVSNKVITVRRHQEAEERALGAAVPAAEQDAALAAQPCRQPDPARTALAHDLLATLRGRLGPLDQRLLDLKMQGWAPAAAAAQLGLSTSALRMRWSRLRAHLKSEGLLSSWPDGR